MNRCFSIAAYRSPIPAFTLDDTVRFDWFDWEEDDKLKCEKDCEEARRR